MVRQLPVRTTHEASADIDFTLNLTGNLYFKFTDITLSSPDFLETIHTLNRKLGINHTPGFMDTRTLLVLLTQQEQVLCHLELTKVLL